MTQYEFVLCFSLFDIFTLFDSMDSTRFLVRLIRFSTLIFEYIDG
jgi:hypothetical protein